jgi:nicotinamide mononucleotide transporter
MSYLEFFGSLFNLLSVWFAVKNKAINWVMGVVGGFLFAFLFFQIRLYSDFLEQIYYILSGFWGWWIWLHPKTEKEADENKQLKISKSTGLARVLSITAIACFSLIVGYFISRIHIFIPSLFTEPAALPYLDALTTVMSFAAVVLMAKKKIESWYLWIMVDIIGIGLYYSKGVVFVSLLYVVFLVLATLGYLSWHRILLNYRSEE